MHGVREVERLAARRAAVDAVQTIPLDRREAAVLHVGDEAATYPAVRAGGPDGLHAQAARSSSSAVTRSHSSPSRSVTSWTATPGWVPSPAPVRRSKRQPCSGHV